MSCYVHSSTTSYSESSQTITFDTVDISGNQIKSSFITKGIKDKKRYLDYKVDLFSLNYPLLNRAEIKYSFQYSENPIGMYIEKTNNETIRVWISGTNATKKYNGRYELKAEVFPYFGEDKLIIDENNEKSIFLNVRKDVQTYRGVLNTSFNIDFLKEQTINISSPNFEENKKISIKFTYPNGNDTNLDVYDFPQINISNIYESESLLLVLWAKESTGQIRKFSFTTEFTDITRLRGVWIITNERLPIEVGTNFITNSTTDIVTNVYTNLFKKNSFTIPLTESDSSAANISSDYITTVRPYIPANSEFINVVNYFFRIYNVNLEKNLLKKTIEENIDKSGKIIDKTVFPNKVKVLYNNKLEAIEYYLKDYIIEKGEDLNFYYKK